MTNDSKSPLFGPSAVFDPANHQPRSGKSALMNQIVAELAGKANVAETIIGNCTTTIPMKFNFQPLSNFEWVA
jgi:ribosomal protein S7